MLLVMGVLPRSATKTVDSSGESAMMSGAGSRPASGPDARLSVLASPVWSTMSRVFAKRSATQRYWPTGITLCDSTLPVRERIFFATGLSGRPVT